MQLRPPRRRCLPTGFPEEHKLDCSLPSTYQLEALLVRGMQHAVHSVGYASQAQEGYPRNRFQKREVVKCCLEIEVGGPGAKIMGVTGKIHFSLLKYFI